METTKKTHWKKHFNPNYLGSYSLDPGEEITLKIIELKDEEVTSPDGKTEVLPVLHFQDSKPLILNKTNAKAVAKIANSEYVEDWVGHTVQIYAKNVKAFGQMMPALRIREVKLKKEKLNPDRFNKMMEAIESGQFNKIDALERFNLTPAQREKIQSL